MGLDHLIYRQAAFGNTDIQVWGYGWLYADWLATLWIPFTWLSVKGGFLIWYGILISCCTLTSIKLAEMRHAYVLLVPALVVYSLSLRAGNVIRFWSHCRSHPGAFFWPA